MEKNCLTCKYEPDWGDWISSSFSFRSGLCKWKSNGPWPMSYSVRERRVIQHKGTSEFKKCDAWKSKGDVI